MFYSKLLKGAAVVAMALMLSSCGGLKTKEVVLKDCVKIQQQKLEFLITEELDEGKVDAFLDVNVKVEALKDVEWGWNKRIKMCLLDKDGVELIYLVSSDAPEKKGAKKVVGFCQTLATCDKTNAQLKEIVSNTKSVSFELEGIE